MARSELAFFSAQHPEAIQVNTARTGLHSTTALHPRRRRWVWRCRPAAARAAEPDARASRWLVRSLKAGVPQDLAEARAASRNGLAAAQHDLADKQASSPRSIWREAAMVPRRDRQGSLAASGGEGCDSAAGACLAPGSGRIREPSRPRRKWCGATGMLEKQNTGHALASAQRSRAP